MTGRTRRTRLSAFALLVSGALLTVAVACGGDEEEVVATQPPEAKAEEPATATPAPTPTEEPPEEPDRFGGVAKYVPQGSIKFIDPHATGAIVTGTVSRHVYDQLFWRGKNFNIRPQVVTDWEVSEGGTLYTFTIRDGITFHNGDPLRIKDVVESHNRFARVDPLGRLLLSISPGNEGKDVPNQSFDSEKLSDTKFTFKFGKATGQVLEFMSALDPRQPSIMHEKIWSKKPGEPVEEAIGTGAYKLDKWVPGERVEFSRFEDYVPNKGAEWDFTVGEIKQYLDGFVALDIPDHSSRVAALETGEVDILDDFRIDLAQQLTGNPDVVWSPIRNGNYGVTAINHRHPPFDNSEAGKLAKLALQAAAPNDDIMQAAVGEEKFWQPCFQVIHCGTSWTAPSVAEALKQKRLKTTSGDLEKGKALISQAKELDPDITEKKVRIIGASDMPFMPEAALVMSETLEKLGFKNVELQTMDWASRVAITGDEGPWELATSWSNFANGLNPLAPMMPSPGTNGWEFPEVGDLRAKFLSEADPEKQQELWLELNRKILMENPQTITHFQFAPPRAIRADVKGFCLDCLFPILHNVWLDR